MIKEENDYMLSTYDNPINPFDNFVGWWKQDLLLGHDCCGTLAREAATSEVFSDEVNERFIDEAADRIIAREPLMYRKVFRSTFAKTASA